MKSNYRSYKVIKRLVVLLSIFLLPVLINAEVLIDKDITINPNTLSFSKNRAFAYCFGYEEECTQAVAGEEVSFSVDQRAVFRWGGESASYKLSFSPLINSTKQSLAAYQFDLSSGYFPYTTLTIRFASQQGATSHSCAVLISDGALSKSMKSRLATSLADQGIAYERYDDYVIIPCQNKT